MSEGEIELWLNCAYVRAMKRIALALLAMMTPAIAAPLDSSPPPAYLGVYSGPLVVKKVHPSKLVAYANKIAHKFGYEDLPDNSKANGFTAGTTMFAPDGTCWVIIIDRSWSPSPNRAFTPARVLKHERDGHCNGAHHDSRWPR